MPSKTEITIRKGVISDMGDVYRLVVELAIYEEAGHEVQTLVSDYEKAFNDGIFEMLVAEYDKRVIGMALYYMAYSTWKGKMIYLEDFVVQNAYRRFGVGQLLFDAFIAESRQMEAKLVKWQVLDWNEPAIAFYQKNLAVIEQNWWNCKLFLSPLPPDKSYK
jgi:GNAT superfamily N-acetyltransferase